MSIADYLMLEILLFAVEHVRVSVSVAVHAVTGAYQFYCIYR